MEFLPVAVHEGGPWAILVAVVLGVSFMIWKGVLVPGPHVDRTVKGYQDANAGLKEELVYWRQAGERKDIAIERQADQLQKLMAYSAVGTHALEDILKEAQKRGTDE